MHHRRHSNAWSSDVFTMDFTMMLVVDIFARIRHATPCPGTGDTLNFVAGLTPQPTRHPKESVICLTTYACSEHKLTMSLDTSNIGARY